MNRRLAVLSIVAVSVSVLAGCSGAGTGGAGASSVDPGDAKACELWSKSEQAMMSVVSTISQLAKSNGVTQQAVDTFNTTRNQLVAAYDAAEKAATDKDLKAALKYALDTDGQNYFTLTNATAAQLAEGTKAVGAVVAKCATQGIDISAVLGHTSK